MGTTWTSIIVVLVIAATGIAGWIMFNVDKKEDTIARNGAARNVAAYKDVILKTNYGDIEIELFTNEMPLTTQNFISLVEKGYFNGTKFHRVIEGFMIQGGDPLSKDDTAQANWGTGGPGYTIKDEFVEGFSNVRGTIAMANTGRPDSGGSQFFINVANNTGLDFDKQPLSSKHPVFGRVTKGMDVVDAIAQTQVDANDRPIDSVIIEEVVLK